ncbi:folliculin-interacting protein 1-like isoform X2 [Babylonia areolata]|uniref:folliculin-interacting protein 1-like isoform X2 n=1 Tax=Babylonia areolata TaxID=304850 RepID=UPI003FD471D7
MGLLTVASNSVSRLKTERFNFHPQIHCENESQYRPRLDKSKIRLIVIADKEKGRVPYFDSNAIQRIDDVRREQKKGFKSACRLVPGNKQVKDGGGGPGASSKPEPKYQFQKMGSDFKLLEEMMFGSVAMAYKGSTLKVHHIRCPPQLVVTKVFYPQKPKPDSASMDTDSDSTPSSLSSSFAENLGDLSTPVRKVKSTQSHVMSIPMDVPMVRESFVDSCDEDSGLYSLTSSGSFQSLFPSPSNNSANSFNSLHRRWMRSQTTSLQRRWDSQETLNSMENSQMRKRKQIKLAIGILFSTSDGKSFQEEKDNEEYRIFQNFFFSHMALIEGHVETLRSSVERAFTGKNMVLSIFEALDTFRDAMHDLYMAPRLREPVWLSMMSNVSYKYALCERFVHEFMFLASKYDNKSTKFFVSTLLSAVLTYHLAWVATVTPGDGTPSKTYLDKHSAKWIDTLAKTHPYNPLWAQLGDLYGAIGNPLRVARTVVVGRKADLVNKVLYVLSYFIRCSDVHEAPFFNCLPALLDSQCWDHNAPIKSVCSMDGSTATLVDLASPPPDSPTPAADVTDTAMCSSCGSCTSALHFYSIQGKKVESPSPKRAVNSTQRDCDRTSLKSPVAVSQCSCSDTQVKQPHKLEQTADPPAVECEGRVVSDDSGIENSGSYEQNSKVKKTSRACKMTDMLIVEDSKLENIQHVRRAAESGLLEEPVALGLGTDSKDSHSKRPVSMLAWQLAADSEPSVEKQKAMIKEAQKQFLSGGSNSMFEEYFDGDAETKTIDDVCEHQRVVKHPLVGSSTASSPRTSPCGCNVSEDGATSPLLKNSVSRQSSTDTKPRVSRPTSLNPARCRSVTPTELSRRRHISSTSSLDMDVFDPLVHCQEISMPSMTTQSEQFSMPSYDKNFGRSLLGGYSDHYMSDFVLHGTSDTSFRPKLLQDLQSTIQHSILDEPVAESVCIIADTDNWTVEVANSRLLEMSPSGTMPWTTSHLVASLIESVLDLHRLKMSAEFCIMHLEDRMQEMYFKSLMLAEYIKGCRSHSQHQLTAMLGFDASDLPLLLSIAGTHTPNLALGSEARVRSPLQ